MGGKATLMQGADVENFQNDSVVSAERHELKQDYSPAPEPVMNLRSSQDNALSLPSASKLGSVAEELVAENDRGKSGSEVLTGEEADIALVKASNN
jgi:hypothetical protein